MGFIMAFSCEYVCYRVQHHPPLFLDSQLGVKILKQQTPWVRNQEDASLEMISVRRLALHKTPVKIFSGSDL